MIFDVVFLSYDEPACEQNWARVKRLLPAAKRVHGVKGIWKAHQACARLASTDPFFLVDGDAEVLDDFAFEAPAGPAQALGQSVFLWRSVNPVNDLVNGHGAVKLVPRSAFAGVVEGLDMTTCVSKRFVRVDTPASVNRFNVSALSAWRGAFRECAKLAGQVLERGAGWERRLRLHRWCNRGWDRPFGAWCIRGAVAGRRFGLAHREDPRALELINDYDALEALFHADTETFDASERVATAT